MIFFSFQDKKLWSIYVYNIRAIKMVKCKHPINLMFCITVFVVVNFVAIKCDPVEPATLDGIDPLRTIPTMEVAIRSQKVFRFQFNPNLFGWSNPKALTDGNSHHLYTYQPSLKGLPDMPYWMRYKYSRRHRAGNI